MVAGMTFIIGYQRSRFKDIFLEEAGDTFISCYLVLDEGWGKGEGSCQKNTVLGIAVTHTTSRGRRSAF